MVHVLTLVLQLKYVIHMEDVRLISLCIFFLATPSWSAYQGGQREVLSSFLGPQPWLPHRGWPKMNTKGAVGVWGSSQRCVDNGSATLSPEDMPDSCTQRHAHCAGLPGSSGLRLCPRHGAVHFVEFTKLVYVKNNGNVLEKVCLEVFSLLFF